MIKTGLLAAVIGSISIFMGIFGFMGRCAPPGARCPSPTLSEIFGYGGLVILVIGVLLLIRAGWRGNLTGSALAAVASVPATWWTYEIARQEACPLLAEPITVQACLSAYGEMTAPVLSFGAAGLLLLVGWSRWRGRAAQ